MRVRNPWDAHVIVYEKDPKTNKIVANERNDDSTGGINEIELNDFMTRFQELSYAGIKDFSG